MGDTVRTIKRTLDNVISDVRSEQNLTRESICSIESQLQSAKIESGNILFKFWKVCSEGNDASGTANKLKELLDIDFVIWYEEQLSSLQHAKQQIETINVEELRAVLIELNEKRKIQEQQYNSYNLDFENLCLDEESARIVEQATELKKHYKITDTEFKEAKKYSWFGQLFDGRKRLIKSPIVKFQNLTKESIQDVLSREEDRHQKSVLVENNLNDTNEKIQAIDQEIKIINSKINMFNELDRIIKTLSVDENIKDKMFELFERQEFTEQMFELYVEKTGDASIVNAYNTNVAKQNMLTKMLASFQKDIEIASSIESKLSSKMYKIRRAASSNGSKRTKIYASDIQNNINKMRKVNSTKRSWYDNNYDLIDRYEDNSLVGMVGWFVIYNTMVANFAFANEEFDQSGALLMFSDEVSAIVDSDEFDFEMADMNLEEMAEIGDFDLEEIEGVDITESLDLDSLTTDLEAMSESFTEMTDTMADTFDSMTFDTDTDW